MERAENGADDDINIAHKGAGGAAFGILHRWFTDVSGLGSAEQARMLMHPSPPEKEEELAEHAEMRQDTMRRLEAHAEEFKCKSKEYFDFWEADHDPELLNTVKYYARRRKLDTTAEKRLHGCRCCRRMVLGGLQS